jgi:hypothetical protein
MPLVGSSISVFSKDFLIHMELEKNLRTKELHDYFAIDNHLHHSDKWFAISSENTFLGDFRQI